jgi:hypothetical protein
LLGLGFQISQDEVDRRYFGSETAYAVRRFQQQAQLPITGAANSATWERLTSRVAAPQPAAPKDELPGGISSSGIATSILPAEVSTTVPSHLSVSGARQQALAARIGRSQQFIEALKTSPALSANPALLDEFISRYSQDKGSRANFWNQLAGDPQFKSAVPELRFTFQLSRLTGQNSSLMAALRAQSSATSLQDLTTLTRTDWLSLINTPVNGQGIPIPPTVAGATREAQVSNYVDSILTQLKNQFPTRYIAQDIAATPTLDVAIVRAALSRYPTLDPLKASRAAVALKGVDTAAVQPQLGALQKEATAFPGIDIRTLLTQSGGTPFANPIRHWVATVLLSPAAADVDIRTSPIDNVHLPALKQVPYSLLAAVVSQLKSLQRLSRLTVDYAHIYILQGAGRHSAFSIAQMPEVVFVEQFGASLGGKEAAKAIHARAANISAHVSNLRMRVGEALHGVTPAALGNIGHETATVVQQSIPNWTELFGNPGTCACTECRSVSGAAAYFVDLMQFLRNSGTNSNGYTPLDILQARRPDLWYLKLTCENTNTELPFIDLVNEILEQFVANNGALPAASNNTPSDATTEQLNVNPEYTIASVYAHGAPLLGAVYPFTLPYDRSLDTLRTYLGNFNTSRAEIMRGFQVADNPADVAIACERLGLSLKEMAIINGTSSRTLAEFYGFSAGTAEAMLVSPSVQTTTPVTTPYLGLVTNFLNTTGLSYQDLLTFIQTRIINPAQQITLYSPASVQDASGNTIPVDPCDVTYRTFQGIDVTHRQIIPLTERSIGGIVIGEVVPGFLTRAYRFIRLWRKMGWSMRELDKVLIKLNSQAAGADLALLNVPDKLFVDLAEIKWLAATLNISILSVLSLWFDIDADGRDSLYNTLFQNKAVISPVDPAFQLKYSAYLPTASFPGTGYPPSVASQIAYTNQVLSFVGAMSDSQRTDLLAWAGSNAEALLAVQNLFDQRTYEGIDVAIYAPAVQQPPIGDHLHVIMAALQVSESDLTAIALDAAGVFLAGWLEISIPLANIRTVSVAAGNAPSVSEVVTVTTFNDVTRAVVGGALTVGDRVELTVFEIRLTPPPHPIVIRLMHVVTHVVTNTDSFASIAADLASQINQNAALNALGVSCTANAPDIGIIWNAQAPLNIANLSIFYRYSVLATGLSLSIPDFIALKKMGGIDPFARSASGYIAQSLIAFVEAARSVSASNFPINQLQYLYLGGDDPADGLPMPQSMQDQLFASLSSGLQQNATAEAYTPDPSGVLLRKKLATVISRDRVDPVMNLIGGLADYRSALAALPGSLTRSSAGAPFLSTRVLLAGSVTPGDSIELTLTAAGLAGSPLTITHTVMSSSETLVAIAADLATRVGSQTVITGAGVTVAPVGASLLIRTPLSLCPLGAWSGSATASGGGPGSESVLVCDAALDRVSYLTTMTFGGSATPGDSVNVALTLAGAATPTVTLNLPVVTGDTPASLAANLAAQINRDPTMSGAGIAASASAAEVSVIGALIVTPLLSMIGSSAPAPLQATEVVTVGGSGNTQTVTLGGAASPGDVVSLTITLNGGTGAATTASYPVAQSDMLPAVASGLVSAINASRALQGAGVSASATAGAATFSIDAEASLSAPPTIVGTVTAAPPVASESITIGGSAPNYTVGIGGAITSEDSLSLVFAAGGAAGTSVTIPYTVLASDSLQNVAKQLCDEINGNTVLQTADIVATMASSGPTFNVFIPSTLTPPVQLTSTASPAPRVATETVTVSGTSPNYAVTIGGAPASGDIVSLQLALQGSAAALVSVSRMVATGEDLSAVAAALGASLNQNPTMQAAGITVTWSGATIALSATPSLAPSQSWAATAVPGQTGGVPTESVTIAGTALCCKGPVSYATYDNLTGLASAADVYFVGAVTDLRNQVLSTLCDGLFFLAVPGPYAAPLSDMPAGLQWPPTPPGQVSFLSTATVSDTVAVGDELTLVATSSALPGSPVTLPTYVVTATDTPRTVAAQLARIISANASLSGAGITATSSGAVILISLGTTDTNCPVWALSNPPATTTLSIFTGLVSAGPLTNASRGQLISQAQSQAPSASATFIAAVNTLFAQAWSDAQEQLIDCDTATGQGGRYDYVLEAVASYRRLTLDQSLVIQTLSGALQLDSKILALLLMGDLQTGTAALLPSASVSGQSAMTDFLGGVLATYCSDNQLTSVLSQRIDAGVQLDGTQSAFGSAQWIGRLVAPSTDAYSFRVLSPIGSMARLQLQLAVANVVVLDTTATPNVSATVTLTAGGLVDFKLNIVNVPAAAQLQLQWRNTVMSWSLIPAGAFIAGAAPSLGLSSPITAPVVLGGAYASLSVLSRSALLVNGFSMRAPDILYLSTHGADFQGVNPANGADAAPFDLSALRSDVPPGPQPVADRHAPALFNQWQRLNTLYLLNSRLPARGDLGLFDLFRAASQSSSTSTLTIASTIAKVTRWDPKELGLLTGSQVDPVTRAQVGFHLTDSQFINEFWLKRLTTCMDLVVRLRVSSSLLFAWATLAPDVVQAQNIQNVTRSRFDATTWIKVGSSLNDGIRNRSRDALVAYILANAASWNMSLQGAPIATIDQLYEYFLIDVQMDACMETSRIVQANAAIQLFVQRCLLGLESMQENHSEIGVNPLTIATDTWNWMQNYRVWEANREVFLYPENYIAPTLRDDKTPQFELLEDRLLQGPITDANVTDAYVDYLYALNDISQLQMCGMYWDTPPNFTTKGTLHVVGRTSGQQPQYYHRSMPGFALDTMSGGSIGLWTPWELVKLQIPGNHILPVVWGGRFFLLWPTFNSTTAPSSQGLTPANASSPSSTAQDLAISLTWSEYKQGAWTPPITSGFSVNPLPFNPYPTTYKPELDKFIFYTNFPNPASPYSVPGANLGIGILNSDPSSLGPNELSNPEFVRDANGNASPWELTVATGTIALLSFAGRVATLTAAAFGGGACSITSEKLPAVFGQLWSASINVISFTPLDNPKISASVSLLFYDSSQSLISTNPANQGSLWAIIPAPSNASFVALQIAVTIQAIGSASLSFSAPSLAQRVPSGLGGFNLAFAPKGNVGSSDSYFIILAPPMDQWSFSYMWLEGQNYLGFPSFLGNWNDQILLTTPQYELLFAQDRLYRLLREFPGPDFNDHLYLANPFFFSDAQRSYFAFAYWGNEDWFVSFHTHWHPFAAQYLELLNVQGVRGLLTIANQQLSNDHPPGILWGLNLSPSATRAPALTTGAMIAGGQLISLNSPMLPEAPANSTSKVYFNAYPYRGFYYTSGLPNDPGDALVGTVTTDANSVTNAMSAPAVLTNFQSLYEPDPTYVDPMPPLENVEFRTSGAYSIYNWELFFHIPLLIGTQLSQNRQFAEAKSWFEYIFNPTSSSSAPAPQRFWRFLPFGDDTEPGRIQDLLELLDYTGTDPALLDQQNQVIAQIHAYKADPFDPFAIARLRPIAFMKKTVMAYLDNLIAWGDSLFSQNTRESINEATQLYVLAEQILGPRPQDVGPSGIVQDFTYNDLVADQLDAFSNVAVQLEDTFPLSGGAGSSTGAGSIAAGSFTVPYFCIPPNDQLLTYWDTVADRLYKIRHCMNIQGQIEQLPLFAPPINPALLVAATAAGVDLSSVLSDINAFTPHYRFSVLLQKALDLCSEVRSLGSALLSALEKRDVERLSLLRATQETQLLQKVMLLKQQQFDEANANLTALNDSQAVTTLRSQYYQGLISAGLSSFETGQTNALGSSQQFKNISQAIELYGSYLSLIPQFEVGVSGIASPVSTVTVGGQQLSTLASMVARYFNAIADNFSFAASLCSLLGQWDRRLQEWKFQSNTAIAELTQITDQIQAAKLRVAIATSDVQNQQMQIDHAQAVQDFLSSKYTSAELYDWMKGRVSGLYFECYQMAYGLAKRAEYAMRYELGLPASNFIQFGYWDNARVGLAAGEALYADLKRMEIAYLDQNTREFEITRNISLLLLDPVALITLKETGSCIVNVPEAFFDMDYPGHYLRRIKTVSLTMPCVTGPYTSINCTLTLLQSRIRWDSSLGRGYAEQPPAQDPRFSYNFTESQSIATSTAQNDSGLFEVNFRDDRYLPFEGLGAISQWMISMPPECNAFDFDTLTDVILTLRYTARDGGAILRDAACRAAVTPAAAQQVSVGTIAASYPSKQANLVRYFSLRHEFPTEWFKFLSPQATDPVQSLCLALSTERFPFQYRGCKVAVSAIDLVLQFASIDDSRRFPNAGSPLQAFQSGGGAINVYVTPATTMPGVASTSPPSAKPASPAPIIVQSNGAVLNGMPFGSGAISGPLGLWWFQLWQGTDPGDLNNIASALLDPNGHLSADVIDDLLLVVRYTATYPRAGH